MSHDKYLSPAKYMTGAEENRHFLRLFIQTYRDLPVLWDTSLRDYTNRDKRAEAYEQLVPIYRYLKRDATVEDVKKKINTLRTNYRKELKVVECARRSGTIHQPRCWTFHELDFLRNTEKFLAVNPNARNDSFAFSDTTQTQSSFIESHSQASAPIYNFRAMLCGTPSAQTPPSISEMFHKSFGHQQQQKLEPEQTPPPSSTSLSLPPPSSGTSASHCATPTGYQQQQQQQQQQQLQQQHNHGNIHNGTSQNDVSVVKRQRMSPNSTTASTTTANTSQNPEELLSIACDYLSGQFPEEESIARTWTYKLKRMQREQRLFAEKFINEILFEGETGTLHRGSVQINTFEPFVRFEEHPSHDEQAKSQSPSVNTSTVPQENAECKESNATTESRACSNENNNFPSYNNCE